MTVCHIMLIPVASPAHQVRSEHAIDIDRIYESKHNHSSVSGLLKLENKSVEPVEYMVCYTTDYPEDVLCMSRFDLF